VFTLTGIGTVVTGTLFGGTLHRGQAVVIQPSGKSTRIRRIQSHGLDVEACGPGTRTALNLADVDASEDVRRGDVVTLAELGGPSRLLDVLLQISRRAARPLKDGLRIRVHHGSGNVAAQATLASGKALAVGAQAIAQLRLESPAFVFAGDRFTVRDWSEQHTLAGAIVLDPDGSRRDFRKKERLTSLSRVVDSLQEVDQLTAATLAREGAVRRSQLLVKSRFSQADVAEAVDRLVGRGVLVAAGDFVIDAGRWGGLVDKAAAAIDAAHRAHPERLGLPLADLHAALEGDLPIDGLFGPLVDSLSQREFSREGSVVRRTSHHASLPEPLRGAGAKVRDGLRARPLDPPSRRELAPDAVSQRALRFLIETGEVVEINADLVMATQALSEATERVRTFIREHGPATVSDLRQALGSSRRVVVPLLEHLDRTFVTLRQGDKRALRR
jgi:selenocysteine-specific elongation factor